MHSFQAPSQKYGVLAAITVFLAGSMAQVFQEGVSILQQPRFWYGLYGWLAVAIVVGYLVYLGLSISGLSKSSSPKISNEEQTELTNTTTISAGELPPWEVGELPAPPTFTWRNILTTIGPGAILLGTSIGSSEWLLGPAVTARYGGFLLWLIPVSIVLQAIINTESIRYTMYTGEPIYTGFMRTAPGPQFWSFFYITLAFLQLSWPGWVSAAATALTAVFIGAVPGPENAYLIKIFGLGWFLSIGVVIIFGDKIERTLEKIEWFLVVTILLFLVLIVSIYTDGETYSRAATGLTNFGTITPGLDWLLICAFVSDAGAGGVINGVISNWYRDKGMGMGSVVGYIPAIVGGRKLSLMRTGQVFLPTPENKRHWRGWWKFVDVDQYLVWGIGCFVGMVLPAIMTLQFIPFGTEFANQFGIAVYQAQYIVLATGHQFLWNITLLIGFWILFSTQLGVTDAFVRMVTDIVWANSNTEDWQESDIRFIYYGVFLVFSLAGTLILFLDVKPLLLILLGANMAGLNMTIISLHTLYVNRKFLPAELKPPLWREIVVVLGAIFYGFLFYKAAPELFNQLFPFV
ncbi:MAG: Nramp family divalent metal transporter [Pleurocapsa sp. MO_192.B19]|nr:Nramp family divalent metal transporter [Pleurocapsa sp. MO_192.B19]